MFIRHQQLIFLAVQPLTWHDDASTTYHHPPSLSFVSSDLRDLLRCSAMMNCYYSMFQLQSQCNRRQYELSVAVSFCLSLLILARDSKSQETLVFAVRLGVTMSEIFMMQLTTEKKRFVNAFKPSNVYLPNDFAWTRQNPSLYVRCNVFFFLRYLLND